MTDNKSSELSKQLDDVLGFWRAGILLADREAKARLIALIHRCEVVARHHELVTFMANNHVSVDARELADRLKELNAKLEKS